MIKLLTIIKLNAMLLFAFFAYSCADKPSYLECDNVVCDTVDTYHIVFNKNDSSLNLISFVDTIIINSEITSCKLEGWHCKSCNGEEVVSILDSAGNKVDSLIVMHNGQNVESSQWTLEKIEKGKIFKVSWLHGKNFYITRN